jgi:hypothetical protein
VLLGYWAALAFLPRRQALLAAALVGASVMLSAENIGTIGPLTRMPSATASQKVSTVPVGSRRVAAR